MNETSPIDTEARAILDGKGGDRLAALAVVQGQLDTLHNRAQVLVSLAGVVVTVTGFSGRLIAGSSDFAQDFLVAGLGVVLASAIWVFVRVMRVRWLTALLARDPENALREALANRERKTRAYAVGGLILFTGLALYCVAVAAMLLNPETIQGPVR